MNSSISKNSVDPFDEDDYFHDTVQEFTKNGYCHNIENINNIIRLFYNFIKSHSYENIELNTFEKYLKKHVSSNFNFFDILFAKNEKNSSLIKQIAFNNNKKLIDDIFEKYSSELKLIDASNWNFIFLEKNGNLNIKIKNFYGDEYYNDISNYLNEDDIPSYFPIHLSKLLKTKKLSKFFENYPVEQIVKHDHIGILNFGLFIHFFVAQKESYINYFSNPSNINLKLPIFQVNQQKDIIYYSVKIPDKTELDTFVFKCFNSKKANIILKEFLETNHNTLINAFSLTSNKKFSHQFHKIELEMFKDIKMNKIELLNFFTNEKIDKKLFMPTIMDYLVKEPELLSHFIINNVVNKEDLLLNIKDPDLFKNDEFIILNEQLPQNFIKSKKNLKI